MIDIKKGYKTVSALYPFSMFSNALLYATSLERRINNIRYTGNRLLTNRLHSADPLFCFSAYLFLSLR